MKQNSLTFDRELASDIPGDSIVASFCHLGCWKRIIHRRLAQQCFLLQIVWFFVFDFQFNKTTETYSYFWFDFMFY